MFFKYYTGDRVEAREDSYNRGKLANSGDFFMAGIIIVMVCGVIFRKN